MDKKSGTDQRAELKSTWKIASRKGLPMARGVNGFKKLRKDAKKQAKSLKRSAKISLGRRATPEELRALGQYAFEQMKGGVQ